MYMQTRQLPTLLRNALASMGYNRPDVAVEATERASFSDPGSAGQRAYVVFINLETGESKITQGSWGGPNIANPTNSVDLDTGVYQIPENCAVIRGSRGHHSFATILIHPKNMTPLLPAETPALSESEQCCLYAYNCLKSGPYRQDALRKYNVTPDVIDGLLTKGLLKRNVAGAIQITTAGKNAYDGKRRF